MTIRFRSLLTSDATPHEFGETVGEVYASAVKKVKLEELMGYDAREAFNRLHEVGMEAIHVWARLVQAESGGKS